ncbi:MAG: hypothetical protein KGP12_09475 [Actinomycetales bacterium]|nr:hypothetical protein [Actinomycetales bacterium]
MTVIGAARHLVAGDQSAVIPAVRILTVGILTVGMLGGVSACASAGSSSIVPQPAVGTLPLAGQAEPMVTATSCADLTDAAQRLPSYHRSLVDGLGTQRDPVPTFEALADALAVMTALAPACEPMAVEEIDALDAAAQDAVARYDTGVVAAMDGNALAALDLMGQRGREAWAAMGMSPAAWP